MPATSLHVSLLTVTPEAEALIYTTCKSCTSSDGAADVFPLASNTESYSDHTKMAQEVLIRRVIDSGHTSVVEHVSFTFAVAGVSRALSHQLVRHRIASYSQQSQRFVKADGFEYIMPPSILKNLEANNHYCNMMEFINQTYEHLRKNHGIPAEDARFVLPNACETKIVVTMNCRALLNFFEERCCQRAQWEIRALANEMLNICKNCLPVVFTNAGPKCIRQGYCAEHKSCGRFPKKVNNAL